MAHERLSPRQKMIGMMYLVLTAMLALNVSKETVKAFMKVDKGLTLTVDNYSKKNNLIYSEFDRADAENHQKAGKYKTAAYSIKERADAIFDYIQDLKIEMIKTADGEDAAAINGRVIDIEKVLKYDDNNIPSQILVGSDEAGKAYSLKAMINEYRDFLITTLEGKSPGTEEALRKSLDTSVSKNEDGETEPWANLMFQTLPLVGATALLTKIQVDIRNAETETLNYLYGQIDASSYKFNKLTPIVIPNSKYVNIGSNYEAKVFISAMDTTQVPEVRVGEQLLPLDETGKGLYTSRATSIGPKRWGGVIALKAPDGTTKTWEFTEDYFVGDADAVVSATAVNVMYQNIDNPIDISIPGVSPDKVKISRVVNGTFSQKKVKNSKGENFPGTWAIMPTTPGQNVEIYLSADVNGKQVPYGPKTFRVRRVPDPVPQFGGKTSGTISKGTATAQTGVFAVLKDFEFDLQYKVTSFTISYADKFGDVEKSSTTNMLTADQKQILNNLVRGKNLTITNIKALAPDGSTRELPSVVLKID
jgi:gliding motility-associated protein GldM